MPRGDKTGPPRGTKGGRRDGGGRGRGRKSGGKGTGRKTGGKKGSC